MQTLDKIIEIGMIVIVTIIKISILVVAFLLGAIMGPLFIWNRKKLNKRIKDIKDETNR